MTLKTDDEKEDDAAAPEDINMSDGEDAKMDGGTPVKARPIQDADMKDSPIKREEDPADSPVKSRSGRPIRVTRKRKVPHINHYQYHNL